jgi:hypothetical protein
VREAVEKSEFNGVLLIGGQFGEAAADVDGVLARDGQVVGPVLGIRGVRQVVADGLEDDPGAAGAEAIEGCGRSS